jgi:biopolymer transport protein ExbB
MPFGGRRSRVGEGFVTMGRQSRWAACLGRAPAAYLLLAAAAGAAFAQEAAPNGAAPGEAASSSPVVASALPAHDLSPWGMFMNADIVVKTVMVGLAFASVVTWTVWLAKSLELLAANRRLKRAVDTIEEAGSLAAAVDALGGQRGDAGRLVRAAEAEVSLSNGLPVQGTKERVLSRFERIEAASNRRMTRGTGVLATIGSTAPFVGLFGTVWGIMNSFVGIAKAQTSNLAVVAPGIAEALLATATGLVAAIPAVMIYNVFARAITGHRALMADASAATLRLVGRDLESPRRRMPAAAE